MISAKSYAAFEESGPLGPYPLERRDPGPNDVVIDIHYSGICHTDIHFVANELGFCTYPLVPGHEIAGVVEAVGSAVTKYSVGDKVGVGCLVNSCRTCANCGDDLEQYCPGGVYTYAGTDVDGSTTQGGYSTKVVVNQDFVLSIPDGIGLDTAAPLLCAGITTYSPLRTWNVTKGTKVAVVGLGGLGHMAVKLAAAMGAEVTVISTSEKKREDAKRLGATGFIISSNADEMAAAANTFDLILNTVSAATIVNDQVGLLARDGTLVLLGIVTSPIPVASLPLIFGRRRIAGSLIGGIKETQEMLDFCGEHGIGADVEVINADEINTAYERMLKSDVRYRFVIDVKSM
ncbi:MAG: NAD(P)-dependent alcohol dehydrogenase [Chthonomonadales bacterium]